MQSVNKILIKPSTFIMITRSQAQQSNTSSSSPSKKIIHVESQREYRMTVDNSVAKVEYSILNDKVLDLVHSYVPLKLRGKGIGRELAKATFDKIDEQNLKMKLTCDFLKKVYIENESKYKHLYVD